jgi:hypothetical protein
MEEQLIDKAFCEGQALDKVFIEREFQENIRISSFWAHHNFFILVWFMALFQFGESIAVATCS